MPKFEMDNLYEFEDRARKKVWKFRPPLFAESEAFQKSQSGNGTADEKADAVLKFLACLMGDFHPEIKSGEDVHAQFGMVEAKYYMDKINDWIANGLTENPTQAAAEVEKQNPSQKSSSDSEQTVPNGSDGVTEE